MKVRILRDTVEYKAGRVVPMDDFLAKRWIHSGLAEPLAQAGEGETPPQARVMADPENRVSEPAKNRARKPRKKAA